jgi:YggT family protein
MLFSNFLVAFAQVLDFAFNFLFVVIFASVAISWLNAPPNNPIVQIIHGITEPLYKPIRKLTKNFPGPIDWAPMILIFALFLLRRTIVPTLMNLGMSAGS